MSRLMGSHMWHIDNLSGLLLIPCSQASKKLDPTFPKMGPVSGLQFVAY